MPLRVIAQLRAEVTDKADLASLVMRRNAGLEQELQVRMFSPST